MTEDKLQEIKKVLSNYPPGYKDYWVPLLRDCVEEIETCWDLIKLNKPVFTHYANIVNRLEKRIEELEARIE